MNPEFRRNLWLEFTTTRMLVVGLLLFLVLGAAFAVDVATSRRGLNLSGVAWVASVCFGVVTVIWGGWLAAATVVHEVRDRTWDAQRMSAQSPWSLTWGKLFGATSLAWFFGAICLAALAGARINNGEIAGLGVDLLRIAGFALLCQSLALFASLVRLSPRPGDRPGNSTLLLFFALIGTILLSGGLVDFGQIGLTFYGLGLSWREFTAASAVAFSLVILIGIYWRMRLALQIRSRPWAWLLILAAVAAYAIGLTPNELPRWIKAALPAFALSLMAYGVILIEPKDAVVYRRAFGGLVRLRLATAFEFMPLWFLAYVAALIAIAISLFLGAGDGAPRQNLYGLRLPFDAAHFLVALGLFLTRDLALLLSFAFGGEARMAELLGFLCWMVLYIPLPIILLAANQYDYLGLFLPTGNPDWMLGVLPALVQAAAAVLLLALRLRAAR